MAGQWRCCVISSMRGGAGKTTVALGLVGAFRRRGVRVAPLKKGPDFIDPSWLTRAAGRPCRNLDAFLMTPDAIVNGYATEAATADLVVIEGNRGLYDGLSVEGRSSTAELAKQLAVPVILVVDCTKVTRTAAALVLGCQRMDPAVSIGGVILNQVAGPRHESVVRGSIERYCGIPVIGAIPRQADIRLPERHLGLVPAAEHDGVGEALARLFDTIDAYVDLDLVWDIAATAGPVGDACPPPATTVPGSAVRIGIVRDAAFHFYYPENLEALERSGAELVFVDALRDSELPEVDGLYIGGGFPEVHARSLERNVSFRESLRAAIERGLPVVAECGGLMYLGESIECAGRTHEMVGVFPVAYDIAPQPQGHGYTVLTVDRPNPYFPVDTVLKGHEFRYGRVIRGDVEQLQTAFRVDRGRGFGEGRDGLVHRNVLASFTHFHARGTALWAAAIVERVQASRQAAIQHDPLLPACG